MESLVDYNSLSHTQLMLLCRQKDADIERYKKSVTLPPTRKEAMDAFMKQVPDKEIPMTALEKDVEALQASFAKLANNKVSKEEALKVMKETGFSDRMSDDLVGGFFSVAELDDHKKVSYSEFVNEIVRMQTYKVMRVIQFRIAQLDKVRGEYDPRPKLPIDDMKELFSKTGLGKKVSDEQITAICKAQVGKIISTITPLGFARWYFETYYPEDKAFESAGPSGGSCTLNAVKSKGYVDKLLQSLKEAVDKPEATTKGSADNVAVFSCYGKLMGLLELASEAMSDKDLAKIFREEEDTIKILEKCAACGVSM